MSKDNVIPVSGGETIIKRTKRGIEFHTFNVERRRQLHIGTLKGRTYEAVKSILQKPNASFALTRSELAAAIENGAEFIRVIPPNHAATYSISVQDFQRLAVQYDNVFYGAQWRVPVHCFQTVTTTAPRNASRDNPAIPTDRDILADRRERQMKLFA